VVTTARRGRVRHVPASSTNSSARLGIENGFTCFYFGSFQPRAPRHFALAEYVVGQGLCDEAVLAFRPQSPYKQARGTWLPKWTVSKLAEIACAASKYPERIKPSVVEFLLRNPHTQ